MNLKKLEEIAAQIQRVLPEGAHELKKEIGANLRALLESILAGMNLVTREEFDTQAALLARTRAKLDQLELTLAELEAAGPVGAQGTVDPPDAS